MSPEATGHERRLETWTALSIAAFAASYYAAYARAIPFGFSDEGYLYYVASAFDAGALPYRDVRLFSYLPGLFYAVAPLLRWPGHELDVARGTLAALLVVRAVGVYACGRLLMRRGLALGVAGVSLLVPGPWHKLYVGGLAVWILAALVLLLRDRAARALPAVHLGSALGTAALLRIDVALVGAGLAILVLAWTDGRGGRVSRKGVFRAGGLAGAAALATHLPLFVHLGRHGLLGDWLGQWTGFLGLAAWRASTELRLSPPVPSDLWRLGRSGAEAWIYVLAVLAISTFVVGSVVRFLRRPAEIGSAEGLLVGLWALGGLPQFAWERPDVPHLTQYSLFFLLAVALLAERWMAASPGPLPTGDGAGEPSRHRAPAAIAPVLLLLAAAYVGKHMVYGEGGSLGLLGRPAHRVVLSNGFAYPAVEVEPFRPLLEHVLAESTPEETLAALPFAPGFAFAAGRSLAGRDVFLAPHSVAGEDGEEPYVEVLRRAPPRFVLFWPAFSYDGRVSGRIDAFAPEVEAHVERCYRPVRRRAGLKLLELRAACAPGPRPSATGPTAPGSSGPGSPTAVPASDP